MLPNPRWAGSVVRSFAVLVLVVAARAQQLEVHVIDVDQGLSVFVKSPTGKRLLIDGGNPGDGNAIIKPYLQSIGVTGLDYSVMTHWHTDHFGGLIDIDNSAYKPVIAAYDRGDLDQPSNGFVSSYLSAVGTKRAIPVVGQVIDLGGGVTATFISRDGVYSGGSVDPSGDENAHSLGLVIRYGDFDLYCAGDLTAGGLGTPNVEGPATVSVGQVEVAIASHHGSPSSSSATVVSHLDPSFVVHSAGHDNPYGHPAEVTIDNWSTTGACRVQWCTTDGDTVLGTGGDPGGFDAVLGHILITTDGTTFHVASSSHPETVDFTTFEHPGTLAGTSQLVVNELLVDPLASADTYGEWFELLNVSGQTLDLGGLQFQSGTQSFTLRSRVLLATGARFLVGVDGRASRNGDVFLGVGAPWQQFSLPNASGTLTVKAANGTTIESLAWGGSGIATQAGVSTERMSPTGGSGAGNFGLAQTAWSSGDLGTPWDQNDNYQPSCPFPIPYGTGKLTSNGTLPYASWNGTPSTLTNDFYVVLVDGMPLKSTIAFWGVQPENKPFFGGTLWVKTPVHRLGVTTTDFNGSTNYAIPVDATMPGTKRYYQFWFRDPFHPDGTNVGLSAALEVQFCPLPAPPAAGDLIVTEIMKDPNAVADSAGEWIELYNTTGTAIDLQGWTVRDDGGEAFTIASSWSVPSHQYAVMASNGDFATNGGVIAGYDWDWSLFKLDNADDEIVLVAPGNVEIDRVMYDNGFVWPDSSGQSISLTSTVLDGAQNDDGNNWCNGSTPISGSNADTGTPGLSNETCP